MSGILDEIRDAYAPWSIEVEGVATYGTYYRLRCGRCGKILGAVGDKLLPGMVHELVQGNFDLYAAGLMGCGCGCQAERANAIDPARAADARTRLA